jgi:1-acyl-sn-glycerol-3-phosphate acyltransferase
MNDRGAACRDRPWSRTQPARAIRELLIRGVFGSIIHTYSRVAVTGLEWLDGIDAPAIFVANHCSHVDTPALLGSLPARWRRRTAVAAAADYFYVSRALANAVSLAFGTVPVERGNGAAGIDHLWSVLDGGWSLVMFAEGTRSRDGRMGPLRTGAAALAAARGVPIVPVHISGTHAAMPIGSRWMVRPPGGGRWARHAVSVTFGPPIAVHPPDDRAVVMERVRRFMEACGAETSPAPSQAAVGAAAARRLAATPGGPD